MVLRCDLVVIEDLGSRIALWRPRCTEPNINVLTAGSAMPYHRDIRGVCYDFNEFYGVSTAFQRSYLWHAGRHVAKSMHSSAVVAGVYRQ